MLHRETKSQASPQAAERVQSRAIDVLDGPPGTPHFASSLLDVTLDSDKMVDKSCSASRHVESMKIDLLKECQLVKDAMMRMTQQLDWKFKGQEHMLKEQLAAYHERLFAALPRDCGGSDPQQIHYRCRSNDKVEPVKDMRWSFNEQADNVKHVHWRTNEQEDDVKHVHWSTSELPESCCTQICGHRESAPTKLVMPRMTHPVSRDIDSGVVGASDITATADPSAIHDPLSRHGDSRTAGASDKTAAVDPSPIHVSVSSAPLAGIASEPTEKVRKSSFAVSEATSISKTPTAAAELEAKKQELAKSYNDLAQRTTMKEGSTLFRLASAAGIHSKAMFGRHKREKRFQCPMLEAVVNSCAFNTAVMIVIVLSTLHVGAIEHDASARMFQRYQEQGDRLDYAPSNQALALDWVFVAFFWIELIMRIMVEQDEFFFGRNMHWNLLDFFVAVCYLSEATLALLGADLSHDYPFLIFFRPVRILRAIRSFKESRRLLLSIMAAFRPFFWVFGFLAISIFIFAVPIQQAVSKLMSEALVDDKVVKAVEPFFINLGITYVSLFMAITSGADWGEMMYALSSIHWSYAVFFLCYISLLVFCVCNIITGIFVEGATTHASKDRDLAMQAEAERTAEGIHLLRELFQEIDENKTGVIPMENFEQAVKKSEIRAVFANLGIDNPESIFRLLDVDASNYLEIDEFVMGCMNLRGGVGKVDIEFLVRENQSLCRRMRRFTRVTKDNLHRLEAVVGQIGDLVKRDYSPQAASQAAYAHR